MWTIQTTLDGIKGNFFKVYDRLDQPIMDFEYYSGHLKRNQDYSTTAFVSISSEKRNYVNPKSIA